MTGNISVSAIIYIVSAINIEIFIINNCRTHAIHSLGTTQVTVTLAILLELLDILLLPTVVTIIILHLLELLLADLLVVLLLIQVIIVILCN